MTKSVSTTDLQSLEWWTVRELANYWRVGQSTILRFIAAGELKAKKIGKSWRICDVSIKEFEKDGVPSTRATKPTADMKQFETAVDYSA